MKKLYYETIYGSKKLVQSELEGKLKEGDFRGILPVLAYFDAPWSNERVQEILEQIPDQESDFQLYDDLIFYLTYFKKGKEYLDQIYPKLSHLKLKLEWISSMLEIDRSAGEEYVSELFEQTDDEALNEVSIAAYLTYQFRLTRFQSKIHELLKGTVPEELKYQLLFTLGQLKDEKVLPLLLKGATMKNDRQLEYLEAIKEYQTPEVLDRLKQEACRRFGEKVIKLKYSEMLHPHDAEFANKIFNKFINSKKLDLQGYTLDLVTRLKETSFMPQIESLFEGKKEHFHTARLIRYFVTMGEKKQVPEIKKRYQSEKRVVKESVIDGVLRLSEDESDQKAFYKTLSEEDQLFFLKRSIDIRLQKGMKRDS